jgi:hypothetical protein
MSKKSTTYNLAYRISQIHTLKFSFKDLETGRIDQLFDSPNALSINSNTSLIIDKEKSTITIDINTELIDTKKEDTLVEHTGRTIYIVNGLGSVYNKEKDNFDLPDELIVQLFGIAYTHSRALLATEISPTIYKGKYMLPVIDPRIFLKNIEK